MAESFEVLQNRALWKGSLELTECRKQPFLRFRDGGTLCGKCGREVANACERSWLNDKWQEALDEERE